MEPDFRVKVLGKNRKLDIAKALTSRDPAVRDALRQAADEETEHLAWTETRIAELGGHKSLLNPLWYAGSLTLGVSAGLLGDKWNLGFLAETERQVESHLDGHLNEIPGSDGRSRANVDQMRLDEIQQRGHRHRPRCCGVA